MLGFVGKLRSLKAPGTIYPSPNMDPENGGLQETLALKRGLLIMGLGFRFRVLFAGADARFCGTLTACVNIIGSSTERVGKGGLCEWAQTELATLLRALHMVTL